MTKSGQETKKNMTSNDTTECFIIYELEHIIAEQTISPRDEGQHVHKEHIAFFNSLETAEAAMLRFIEEKKKHLKDKEYHSFYLSYLIAERQVFNRPNTDDDSCNAWNSYTADGQLDQKHIA
jgi:hypothetical protein